MEKFVIYIRNYYCDNVRVATDDFYAAIIIANTFKDLNRNASSVDIISSETGEVLYSA